jgi:hypothetical protein
LRFPAPQGRASATAPARISRGHNARAKDVCKMREMFHVGLCSFLQLDFEAREPQKNSQTEQADDEEIPPIRAQRWSIGARE